MIKQRWIQELLGLIKTIGDRRLVEWFFNLSAVALIRVPLAVCGRNPRVSHPQFDPSHESITQNSRLSSTLANFSSSSGARNAEHWIVLDDVVSALEHEFHTAEVAEGAPAIMDVGPIKQLEAIGIGNRAQPCDWI
jgi:hypothetical protein